MTYAERFQRIHTWCLEYGISQPWAFFSRLDRSIEGDYLRWRRCWYSGGTVTDADERWLKSMEDTIAYWMARNGV